MENKWNLSEKKRDALREKLKFMLIILNLNLRNIKGKMENNKEYMRKYMNNKYHTDFKYRKKAKILSGLRIKAMQILSKKYNKDFHKILNELRRKK